MYLEIINFWFDEIEPKMWWKKDTDFDEMIRTRFLNTHSKAIKGELYSWRDNALGSLAEVIILDQFSRNIYRDTEKAFACDSLALVLAQTAISKGYDTTLTEEQRSFLYIPFMHSESKLIHEEAVTLYKSLENKRNLEFELRHKAIIDRFGRYPHRNKILGRRSTPEEIDFLKEPGSSF